MQNGENYKRLFNPSTDTAMETLKKRRLENGMENIIPSAGLIGLPSRESFPWSSKTDAEKLAERVREIEAERQARINRATYETTWVGPIKEIVLAKDNQ